MAHQAREILRKAWVLDRQRALDADGGLVLRDEKAYGEDDQDQKHTGKDPVVPSPVLPSRFRCCRHSGGQPLQPERRTRNRHKPYPVQLELAAAQVWPSDQMSRPTGASWRLGMPVDVPLYLSFPPNLSELPSEVSRYRRAFRISAAR
jgi:hypothetical protein